MKQLIYYLYIFNICLTYIQTQILYQCNFDNATIVNSCFLGFLPVSKSVDKASSKAPIAPLSDVTSSLKSTTNGQTCKLPYKVKTFSWNMYFCNEGFCPTQTNQNTECSPGQFGYYEIWANNHKVTYQLNTSSSGINGVNRQCLIYYYYMSTIPGTTDKITVRKVENTVTSSIIDTVTDIPFNGWVRRNVTFTSAKPGYQIYFDFERTSGAVLSQSYVAVDEISIFQGDCTVALATTTTRTSTTSSTTRTSTTLSTTKPKTSTTTSSTITTTKTQLLTSTTETTTSTKTSTTMSTTTTILSSTTTIIEETSSMTSPFVETTISDISTATDSITTALSTMSSTTATIDTIKSTFTQKTETTRSSTTSTTTLSSSTSTKITTTTTSTSSTTSTRRSTLTTTFVTQITTLGEKENENPSSSKKTLIIALTTSMVGVAVLVSVAIFLWMKKSALSASGLLGNAHHPFFNLSEHDESSNFVELDHMREFSV